MSPALAVLESALRARQLDRTLTTALPPLDPLDAQHLAATGVAPLDTRLSGGLPRGQLSELVGPRSSGRTTLLHAMLAAATARGELVALIDTLDRLDVESAEAAGIDLARLLWVRGQAISRTEVGLARGWTAGFGSGEVGSLLERTIDRALKAWTQVLQAGGFGLVVLDLADVPMEALARLPFTTWIRIQRLVEARDTVALVVAPAPVARSAAGVTLQLQGTNRSTGRSTDSVQPLLGVVAGRWVAEVPEAARFAGLDVDVRIVSPRRRMDDRVALTARA